MVFSILTLFPEQFASSLSVSILKRALEKKLIEVNLINIRDFAADSYGTVDDRPYGGGVGMIMRVDVIDRALMFAKKQSSRLKPYAILLDPKGKTYVQQQALGFSKREHLILVCGHYEGVDQRVSTLVDESISIGNFIVTGGELPAMVVVDSVTRLIPGVINAESSQEESFSTSNRLEAPQYTRPEVYKNMRVPNVLLSGHHEQIEVWRSKHKKVTEVQTD